MLDWLIPQTPMEWVLSAAVVVLTILPPKWDPAIRLKEWNEAWRKRLEDRDRRR